MGCVQRVAIIAATLLVAVTCLGQGFRQSNPNLMVLHSPLYVPCDQSLDTTNLPNIFALFIADHAITNAGGYITNLPDVSGHGHFVSNQVAGILPVISNAFLNGHAVIKFDGIDDYLINWSPTSAVDTVEVAYLGRLGSASGWASSYNLNWWGAMESAISQTAYSTWYNGVWSDIYGIDNTNFHVFNDLYDYSSNLVMFYDNKLMVSYAEWDQNNPYFRYNVNMISVGADSDGYGYCPLELAEMAIFTSHLSAANRTNLFNYWMCKYGLAPQATNPVPDIFTANTVTNLQYWFRPENKMWVDTQRTQLATNLNDMVRVWADASGHGRDISDDRSPAADNCTLTNVSIEGTSWKVPFFHGYTNAERLTITGDPGRVWDTTNGITVFSVQKLNIDYAHLYVWPLVAGTNTAPIADGRLVVGFYNAPGGLEWMTFGVFGAGWNEGLNHIIPTNWALFRTKFITDSAVIYTNTILVTNVAPVTGGGIMNGLLMGMNSDETSTYAGPVAEVLVYAGHDLTDAECQKVERYLTNKYQLHP